MRELFEETALIAGALAPLRTVAIGTASAVSFDLTVFVAETASGTLAAGDDADAAGWFDISELERMDVIESVRSIAAELLTAQPCG